MKNTKFLSMLLGTFFALILVSCSQDDSDSVEQEKKYLIAEAQLIIDYKECNISNIVWSTKRDYQIANFNISTMPRTQSKPITVWYVVAGLVAKREMSSENLGVTIPDKIKEAFQATKYSDSKLWRVEEIELDHNYNNNNNNNIEVYYELDLQNILNKNLEAELFFSYDTGVLLYSKEDLDDDDSSDDDKFVINDKLRAAVEKAVPGASIIEAEIDDNLIEVDAIIITSGVQYEIELVFSMNYELVSSETETQYLYSQLPIEYKVIQDWFTSNSTVVPAPSANTKVEISKGSDFEDDYNIGTYFYEVEISDYFSGGIKYEVEFYLNENIEIIAVIVNDVKQL